MRDREYRRMRKVLRTREQILQDAFAKCRAKERILIIPKILLTGISLIALLMLVLMLLGL